MKKWALLAVFAIACLLLAGWSIRTTSITVDETFYLSCALQTLQDHHWDPRIAQYGVAPLPILLEYIVPTGFVESQDRPEPYLGQKSDPPLIVWPRWLTATFSGVCIAAIVFLLIDRRHGTIAATAAAVLSVFSPTILAHSSLATTDGCFALFVLVAVIAIAAYFKQPTRFRFLLLALAMTAAIAAKYTGLVLLPVIFLFQMFRELSTKRDTVASFLRAVVRAAGFLLLLVLVLSPFLWGLHHFGFATTDSGTKLPAPLVGILFQYHHNQEGYSGFMAGRFSSSGWWLFYPYTFLLKSTPAELGIAAFLLGCLIASFRSALERWRSLDIEVQVAAAVLLLFAAMVLTFRVDAGHRYLLPMYPLLIFAGIDRLWSNLKNRQATAGIAAALVALQVWSCLGIAPHYLSYFNGTIGGPKEGWRYLVDSNLDWGQDLPALRQQIEKQHFTHVALAYFGSALPQAYGVAADSISKLTPPLEDYQAVAVSATMLQGPFIGGENPFKGFLSLEPDLRAGYSILIYRLSDAPKKAAFRTASDLMRKVNQNREDIGARLNLYLLAMILLSSEDYKQSDMFDLCYAGLFENRGAARSLLTQADEQLKQSVQTHDYRANFRQALLHIARLLLLPEAVKFEQGNHWAESFDYNQFREDYSSAFQLLNMSAEVGKPLLDCLRHTASKIDQNRDGTLSDSEITQFLATK